MNLLIVLGALVFLMFMAYRGYSVILFAPVAALGAVLLTDPALVAPMFSGVFMEKMVGFVKSYFPVFMLGAVFGKVIELSGFSKSIVSAVIRLIGSGRAMLSIVLVCAILTYGGVSLFVVVRAVEDEASRRGLSFVGDMNETPGDGFFAMPLSQDAQGRGSSARCYLTAEVRRRVNLKILTEATVTSIHFDGARACGATMMCEGEARGIAAREVIVCAGAIHSPALLLRAGIGPSEELARLGITPRADRAGVGRNLQNHPYLHFGLTLPPRSRLSSELRRFAIAGLRLSSGLKGCPAGDLLLFMIGRVSGRDYGCDLAMFGAALYAPYSRGQVTLTSAQSGVPPRVEFRMFEDSRDPPRMFKAARFAESLLLSDNVAAAYHDAFLLPPVMSLQQFNRTGIVGSLMGLAIKAVLNAPPALTRAILARRIRPGRWIANRRRHAPASDTELFAAAAPMAHPAGTCAIGRASDNTAVVDPHCRVYGVENLRVVDASVMPRIPSANTNLPTIMVAERAAELICSERK